MVNDNRETCGLLVPSSCIPYTGYVSPKIVLGMPSCRPNINDAMEQIQVLLDKTIDSLGDNTALQKNCLGFDAKTVTQKELNQLFITQLCQIKTALGNLPKTIDPTTILLAVDLLCLQDQSCTPKAQYTLTEIILKLIAAYCDLQTRVTAIETFLNL